MLGRLSERDTLDHLLHSALAGRSATLVVRGEAGIGKSVLLGYAADQAGGAGMRVLSARGVESESELAFSGLADILRPLLGHLEAIPPANARRSKAL